MLIIYEIKTAQAQIEYPLALSLALAAVWSRASDSWMLLPYGVLFFPRWCKVSTSEKFPLVRILH